MKKLLYLGHGHHNKTKSTVFLLDLLQSEYDVTRFDLDPQREDCFDGLDRLENCEFDVLVVFQVMPDIGELKKHIQWRHGVFFPMYDYYQGYMTLDREVWYEYADFTIINFSKKLHEKLRGCGFDSHYVQYFPKPAEEIQDWGDEKALYFWQRLTSLNLPLIARVLKNFDFRRLHVHKVLDPGETFTPIPADGSDESAFFTRMEVSESNWYDTREEMRLDMLRSSVYMAPRPYEGIGMSFLEAMANGRCVVAPDCPTMNEYITDGENGLLYHWDGSVLEQRPAPIGLPKKGIREIQRVAYEFICRGYAQWQEDQKKILDWIADDLRADRPKIEAFAKRIGWVDSPIEEQPRPDAAELEKSVVVKEPAKAGPLAGTPDVSVVTVVFNAVKGGRKEQFLQCMDSVQRQTGIKIEHLIVDGGSADGTVDLVKSFANDQVRIRFFSGRDDGIYDGMNRGLALARGKYVIFLNSDDYYHDPLGLRDSCRALELQGADFCYSPAVILDEHTGQPMEHPNAHPNPENIFSTMVFSHQTMMVSRRAMTDIHGFDLRYRSSSDYDSVLRLVFSGFRSCYAERAFVTFRMGGFSCVNMARSQRETGIIFSRLYNQYLGLDLTREEGRRLYLSKSVPVEMRDLLEPYFVRTFGETLARVADQTPCEALLEFKRQLLPMKTGGRRTAIRCVTRVLLSHPLLLVCYAWAYLRARTAHAGEQAPRMAFDRLGRTTARPCVRQAGPRSAGGARAVGNLRQCVKTTLTPNDFFNVTGIHDVEVWGAWSPKTMQARIRIPDSLRSCPLKATLTVGGYVFPEDPVRKLTVAINGSEVQTLSLTTVDPCAHEFMVPADLTGQCDLNFVLTADRDFVPRDLGHGLDTRRLGISFVKLEVEKRK